MTPRIRENPTDSATVYRSPVAKLDCAVPESSIKPEAAITFAASAETTIKAGSATVVPNPNAKANKINQNMFPFLANASANSSPTGNKLRFRPWIKNVSPKIKANKPIKISNGLGKGCCSMMI